MPNHFPNYKFQMHNLYSVSIIFFSIYVPWIHIINKIMLIFLLSILWNISPKIPDARQAATVTVLDYEGDSILLNKLTVHNMTISSSYRIKLENYIYGINSLIDKHFSEPSDFSATHTRSTEYQITYKISPTFATLLQIYTLKTN